MKTKRYQTQSLLLASLLAACAAQAGPIIYDNGAPDFSNATVSDAALGIQLASNFTLGSDNVLADIHWWGALTGIPVDNFTIYIYNDNAGDVGTLAHTIPVGAPSRTDTGNTLSDAYKFYSYSYDLVSPITLSSGVPYWLSILNDTTGHPSTALWLWATSSPQTGDDRGRFLNPPTQWSSRDHEYAYNLTGPNPTGLSTSVPDGGSTVSLLGLALAGLAWLHRRVR